jgi:hypothetical protein
MTAQNTTCVDLARHYLSTGHRILPIRFKVPWDNVLHRGLTSWQSFEVAPADVDRVFSGEVTGVGIVLGVAPLQLHDVDLDCAEACAAADVFLPVTPRVFGRASTPRAHRIYEVRDQPLGLRRYRDPINDTTLLELRGRGGHTVFPGSLHDSGEVVRFDEEGAAALVAGADLRTAVEHRSSGPTAPKNPDEDALADTCVTCRARAVAWGPDGSGWCDGCWQARTDPPGSGARPVAALTNRPLASDATVALVEDIFGPGVLVVAERQPAVWPPGSSRR